MQSLLDSGEEWFLESLTFADELRITVAEGIRSGPEYVDLGSREFEPLFRIEVSDESRRLVVRFAGVLAFQRTDESYVRPGSRDVRTVGRLTEYSSSAYLDYVYASTHIATFANSKPRHFAVILADDVIDVIATAEPVVEEAGRGHGPER